MFVAYMVALKYYGKLACPRCGKPFWLRQGASRRRANYFTRVCVHCGIVVGTPKPPDGAT